MHLHREPLIWWERGEAARANIPLEQADERRLMPSRLTRVRPLYRSFEWPLRRQEEWYRRGVRLCLFRDRGVLFFIQK